MDLIWFLVYFVIIFVSIAYLFFKYSYSYWSSRGVPYIKPNIPLGNFPVKSHFVKMFVDAYKLKTENHRFVGAYMFSNPVAIPTDLDLIKDILKKDFEYFSDRGFYYNERDDPLSVNLLNIEGKKWKNLRAKLTPTFTSGKMKFMFPTIVEVGNEFSKTLSGMLSENNQHEIVIEIKELISRFTVDVIGTCAFGIECNSLKDPNATFLKMGNKAIEDSLLTMLKRFFELQFRDLARTLHMKSVSSEIEKFFMNVVRETVEYREKNNIRRNDFMDLLIELKNGKFENGDLGKLTMNEIAAQAFLFFIAGFETSATTMSFAIYELALHPDLQEKARKEISEVIKKHNGVFTYEAMMEMVYIDQIISETLRLYPAIALIFRKATKNYKVPDTTKVIEKGVSTMIPAYAIHHDAEIYPDPEKFDPDRFTADNIKMRHSCSFLGFGDGLRNCIGSRFGRMQTRIGLVYLLQKYKFEKCSKTTVPVKFSPRNPILTSEGGLWLKIKEV